MINKTLYLNSTFKAIQEDEDDLIITGMASTEEVDRSGDRIETSAWKGGLTNFKKNPIILFNHNYNRPIGRARVIKIVEGGLELEAKISKAAGEIVDLIKDGVLGAFSVGLLMKDAAYDTEEDVFVIKKAELLEVSVVAVPANQGAVFSVKKSFDNKEDYDNLVKSYSVDLASGRLADDNSASNTPEGSNEAQNQEKKMDPKEIQDMMKEMAKELATANAIERAKEKAEAEAEKIRVKEAEEAATKAVEDDKAKEQEIVKAAAVVVSTGTDQLMKDIEDKLAEKDAKLDDIIKEFKEELASKEAEFAAMRSSKMTFADRNKQVEINEHEFVEAKILGEITRKGWDTDFGKGLIEKVTNDNAGVRVPTSTNDDFETIVSTTIERDIELELVLAPLFRTIQMNAASMVIPTMPDAGYAEWLATGSTDGTGSSGALKGNLDARNAASPGANDGIDLGNKVLTVDKLVSKTYIADETEEDAILPILPLLRESMTRAHARAIEHSLLLGGSTVDLNPSSYNGLFKISVDDSVNLDDGTSPVSGAVATAAKLLDLRQAMGKYGKRPSDVIYIVSLDAYYDLLDDAEFQNINEVGADMATKVKGSIGQVYGSAVIVCDEFPAKANGNPFAVAVNPRGFLMPILRGIRVEQDRDVENQRLVLVSTQRRGFDQMFTTAGQVVSHTW